MVRYILSIMLLLGAGGCARTVISVQAEAEASEHSPIYVAQGSARIAYHIVTETSAHDR